MNNCLICGLQPPTLPGMEEYVFDPPLIHTSHHCDPEIIVPNNLVGLKDSERRKKDC